MLLKNLHPKNWNKKRSFFCCYCVRAMPRAISPHNRIRKKVQRARVQEGKVHVTTLGLDTISLMCNSEKNSSYHALPVYFLIVVFAGKRPRDEVNSITTHLHRLFLRDSLLFYSISWIKFVRVLNNLRNLKRICELLLSIYYYISVCYQRKKWQGLKKKIRES